MGFKPSTMGVKRIEWDDLPTLEMGFHWIWLINNGVLKAILRGRMNFQVHRAAQRHHGDVGHWTHLPVGIWWRTLLRSMEESGWTVDHRWLLQNIAHGYMLYNCKWLKYIYQNMRFWGPKPVHAFAFLSLMFCSVLVCSFKTNVCGLTHTPLLLKLG